MDGCWALWSDITIARYHGYSWLTYFCRKWIVLGGCFCFSLELKWQGSNQTLVLPVTHLVLSTTCRPVTDDRVAVSISVCFWVSWGFLTPEHVFSVRLKVTGGWRAAKSRRNQDSSLLVTVCGGWREPHYTYLIVQFSLAVFYQIQVKICTFSSNMHKTGAVCLMHNGFFYISCVSYAQGHCFSHKSVLW